MPLYEIKIDFDVLNTAKNFNGQDSCNNFVFFQKDRHIIKSL